jgi:hypothetical protein
MRRPGLDAPLPPTAWTCAFHKYMLRPSRVACRLLQSPSYAGFEKEPLPIHWSPPVRMNPRSPRSRPSCFRPRSTQTLEPTHEAQWSCSCTDLHSQHLDSGCRQSVSDAQNWSPTVRSTPYAAVSTRSCGAALWLAWFVDPRADDQIEVHQDFRDRGHRNANKVDPCGEVVCLERCEQVHEVAVGRPG